MTEKELINFVKALGMAGYTTQEVCKSIQKLAQVASTIQDFNIQIRKEENCNGINQ
jgi:hypothetical protein